MREGLYGVVSGDSLEAHGLCHHGIKVSAFQRSLILGMGQMFHIPPMRAPPLVDISVKFGMVSNVFRCKKSVDPHLHSKISG